MLLQSPALRAGVSRSHPAPAGWTEIEQPPEIIEKYNPREPTLFEHDDGEPVAVHVLPETQNIHDRQERWRVGVVHGGKTNFEGREPIRTGIPDRQRALTLAEEFMTGYEQRVRPGEMTLDALVVDCCEPAVKRIE